MTGNPDAPRSPFAGGLWRLRPTGRTTQTESLRIERVIAVARVCLTLVALVMFVAVQPAPSPRFARPLLVMFAAHSLSALFVLRKRQRTTTAFALTTHTMDVLAAAIALPLAGSGNAFAAFYLFALAAAAFRWGFRETVATTIATLALVAVHAQIALNIPSLSLGAQYDIHQIAIRAVYLTLTGLLFGYLAEEGRLVRSEMAAMVTLLNKIRVDAGMPRVLDAVAHELLSVFNASRLLLVVEEVANQRLLWWDTSGGWSVRPSSTVGELATDDRSRYFFWPPDHTLVVAERGWTRLLKSGPRVIALDATGRTVDAGASAIPDEFLTSHPFRTLLSAPVGFGAEWNGRVFIFDPVLDVRPVVLAHFLQTLVRQLGPAVFGVYLLGQLRARAGALERARVARELHDGVIQSLIGVEMQLEVLRGREALKDTPAGQELTRLQGLLRSEVLNLRELMQQMRPQEFDPDELLDHLADMVQRFGRDTGITARFVSDRQHVLLPRHVCFELVRIVQEGLVNVRKHSAATNVLVRFGAQNGFWTLEIDDDGRGFPFEGRLVQEDLDAKRSGPIIIKERVRAIGGQLAIHSTPGRGSRLEVLVPQEARG